MMSQGSFDSHCSVLAQNEWLLLLRDSIQRDASGQIAGFSMHMRHWIEAVMAASQWVTSHSESDRASSRQLIVYRCFAWSVDISLNCMWLQFSLTLFNLMVTSPANQSFALHKNSNCNWSTHFHLELAFLYLMSSVIAPSSQGSIQFGPVLDPAMASWVISRWWPSSQLTRNLSILIGLGSAGLKSKSDCWGSSVTHHLLYLVHVIIA